MKKLKLNSISSLIYQIVLIINGFILPRLILQYYGSDANGLVNSISQFLGFITICDCGVGAVVQSSLYKPIADNDKIKINQIITSAQRFFNVIVKILVVYIFIVILYFVFILNTAFSSTYIIMLIIAISISYFAQYYFGLVDSLFISANQKVYIKNIVQTITLIVNTALCVSLIKKNFSIQIIKLVTSIVFLSRPIIIRIYINKNYKLNRKEKYDVEPITQKWNGLAQHIAAIILDNTDVTILTIFSTLGNVSIYSVYIIILSGIRQLVTALTSGIQSLWGNLYAKKEYEKLTNNFNFIEYFFHFISTFLFGCTVGLIVPFVSVYTKGINDINYLVYDFAFVITMAYYCHCLRIPYHVLILATNKYKETQKNFIIASVLNLGISIILVNLNGLVGVACGTLVAMLYQTLSMAYFDSKNIIEINFFKVIKYILTDFISIFIGFFIFKLFKLNDISYFSWIIMAIKSSLIYLLVIVIINYVFYKDFVCLLINKYVFKGVKK